MTLAPALGCIAGPMERLQRCFEATSQWAAFVAGISHDPFIFNLQDEPPAAEEYSETELNNDRPFVYLCPDYPQGFTIVSDATDGSFRSGGVTQACIETTVERLTGGATATQQEVSRLWDNFWGKMLIDLFWQGWNGNHLLDIRRIDSLILWTPGTITAHGQGDFVKASFKVHWGRDV